MIVHVSSPSPPYDAGEMRSESRPRALNASRASTSSPRRGEHFLRAFQTLVSHADFFHIVGLDLHLSAPSTSELEAVT